MKQALTMIEQDLCRVSAILSVALRADPDELGIEIDSCLELCSEMIDKARQKLTSQLILMQIEKAEI